MFRFANIANLKPCLKTLESKMVAEKYLLIKSLFLKKHDEACGETETVHTSLYFKGILNPDNSCATEPR